MVLVAWQPLLGLLSWLVVQRLIEISKNHIASANDRHIVSQVPKSIQMILVLVAKITLKVTQELALSTI